MALIKFLIAAQLVGFDSYIPPFFTARGPEILKGVNYASGSAGIRPETGKLLVVNYIPPFVCLCVYFLDRFVRTSSFSLACVI